MNYKWSPEITYAIGLIATDGCLSSDGRHISLTSSDVQLLNTFKKCLNLKNRLCHNPASSYSKKPSYKVTFGNVKFYRWLQKIGLTKRKSLSIGRMAIPKKYFADFIRGHIDGDGSIFKYIDRYNMYKNKIYTNKRLYIVLNSGSYAHLCWIHSAIKEILNVKGGISGWTHENRENPLWKLKFSKNDSRKILRWLYYKTNIPCLERKRKVAESFLKNEM